jgi:hypothetical protein
MSPAFDGDSRRGKIVWAAASSRCCTERSPVRSGHQRVHRETALMHEIARMVCRSRWHRRTAVIARIALKGLVEIEPYVPSGSSERVQVQHSCKLGENGSDRHLTQSEAERRDHHSALDGAVLWLPQAVCHSREERRSSSNRNLMGYHSDRQTREAVYP